MTNASRELRLGLVGAGLIGQQRARAIAASPGLRLVAVADLDETMARKAAGGARIMNDAASLAADPEIDAIIVATPPSSHEALGLMCLQAGKHVLIEKPLATSLKSCERLVVAAELRGLRLATGFNLRLTRAAILARSLLDAGAIGALDHVRGFHGHQGGEEFTHDWISDQAVAGGGALMDNGIHVIDLVRSFLGEVTNVHGFATSHTWQRPGCEDNGFLLFQNAKGNVGAIQASWTEWRGYGYRIEIYGTSGFIRFGYPPLHLIHGSRQADGRMRTRRFLFPSYQILERLRGWEWGLQETLSLELNAFAKAIRSGTPLSATGRDGLEAVRIALSATRL